MNNDLAIRCRGLRVVRGGRTVLPGLDLDVPAGQLVGLLGPSGGGKSTLMRSVVGAQRVAGGEVTVLGLPAGHRELRSRVGYVTQAASVYDDLTIGENLRYFAKVVSAPPDDVERVLAEVDLADRSGSVVSELSGGQRSRVSLAVALLGQPELLVLDEPTVGLDPRSARLVKDLLGQLRGLGTAVFLSTHILEIAERMCDRVVIIDQGNVVAAGTMDELRAMRGQGSLEDIFLGLTGGAEYAAIAEVLA
jgi:ABC-2 type transport system ATP-binding protein